MAIEDFTLLDAIGEGTSGQVRLALQKNSGQMMAVKIVSKRQPTDRLKTEVLIQQSLRHENIIRLFETFQDPEYFYIIMELGAGGELFDKIAPDVGVDEQLAHFYFSQLIAGVEYMQQHGVCHRDLKPENLLLDESGNLKIADFGLATLYRHKGVVRRLNTICGTPVYIAPEIQFGDYDGAAVDIWSCGIILFVLLCGNTPWDEPSENSQEFCMFCTRPQLDYPPWNRLSAEVLHLLKGILNVYEDQRYKASQIKKHQWFSRKNYMMHENGKCNDPLALATRLFSQLAVENQQPVTGASQMSIDGDIMATQTQQHPVGADFGFSQPVFFAADSNPQFSARFDDTSFSQPAHAGLLSANNLQSQRPFCASQGLVHLFKITRFYSRQSVSVLIGRLKEVMEDFLVPYKLQDNSISFSTVDRRKCPLTGDIKVQSAGRDIIMANFRRRKGDPVEFTRFYRAVKEAVSEMICPVENQYS